jgi:glycosyltransferase domain-containing protein
MSDNTLLDKVSIIIPSYYLHNYLKRTLDYYKNMSVKIIVVDSTDIIFKEKDEYAIEYYHLPNMTYSKKLYFAAQKVKTDYIILCSHDDFVLLDAIEENVDFLENNKDYSTSQGATLFYNMKYNCFNVLSYIDYSNSVYIIGNKSNIRIEQQFNTTFTHQVYSLSRKEIFEDVFKYCSQYDIKDIAISELIQAGIYSISGKFNIFPLMYYIQENLDISAGNIYPTYLKTKKNAKDHQNLRLILSDYLYKNSDFSREESSKCIDNILSNFLANFEDSFFVKLKKIIRKQIPNIIFKYKHLKRAANVEKEIYGNLSTKEKEQFDEIKKFIKEHKT